METIAPVDATPAPPDRDALRARILALRDALTEGLVERAVPVRLALLAALAGEHILLVGPPGTAKSEIARRLRGAFTDARFFERLLTRFSVPEELFGPLSLRALERDEYLRLTDGYLPWATVAFLDEIFKANSAILNALLTILNEREFDNGARRVRVPLACVVAASNELPDGDELHALYDRFLLRFRLDPVTDDGFDALLALGDEAPGVPPALRFAAAELAALRADAGAVRLTRGVRALLASLRRTLTAKGIYVSDRRWRKVAGVLRVAAYTDGRDAVSLTDCWLLQHCTWARPEQRQVVRDWYDGQLASVLVDEPGRYETLAATFEKALAREAGARSPRFDDAGRPLYVDEAGGTTPTAMLRRPRKTTSGEDLYYRPGHGEHYSPGASLRSLTALELHRGFFPDDPVALELYLADPANLAWEEVAREPAREPTRYAAAHRDRRLEQVDAALDDARWFLATLDAHLGLEGAPAHLWATEDVGDAVRARLGGCRDAVSLLVRRLAAARDGFAALPARDGFAALPARDGVAALPARDG